MAKINEKIKEYIEKDSGKENESGKLFIISRLVFIVAFCYTLFATVVGLAYYTGTDLICLLAALLVNVLLFFLTYKLQRKAFIIVSNVFSMLLVIMFVRMFGWESGADGFIFVVLVLTIFATYKDYTVKILYAVFLMLARAALYLMCTMFEPVANGYEFYVNLIQLGSTVAIIAALVITCLVFGADSQKVESKLVEYNIKLENEANTDSLTGLPNRRRGVEYMQNYIENNPCTPFCVAMCDIDFFKRVNDNYGHDVGDAVLKGIADAINELVDESTFACRWGGEEFIVIFAGCNGDDAFYKLASLQKQIRCLLFKVYEKSFTVSMTMGLEEYDFKSSIEDLVKKADDKLYYGKEHGRDQIVF